MPDIFISYASKDLAAAEFMHKHLIENGVTAFLASASLKPGQLWSKEILKALRDSNCVLFLASEHACSSPWVQQELGYAIGAKKKLIPIVWNMKPSKLPGWASEYQALDLSKKTAEEVRVQMTSIASGIRANKQTALLVAGLAIAAVFFAK
jgi:TIR domain